MAEGMTAKLIRRKARILSRTYGFCVGDEEDPAEHPERLAGSIAPFGVSQASDFDDEHAGQGLTFVLEITDIVDQLHIEGGFDVDSLPVRIVPVRPIARKSELSIGRISIFRQGR